jgi:UDP-N-acetylglucosamine 2-epimerase (non-hydrolysing)
MKMAPILQEMSCRPHFEPRLIHTGQHYSPEMSDNFFRDLGMPEPGVNLEVGSGSHTMQTSVVMQRLEPVFQEGRPDLALVVGDVNSTMAAALVAAKLGIKLAHVEAGLRSFDRTMPEEINRMVTDAISDFLFCSEPSGVANLRHEGVPEARISLVGNVMIDTLLKSRQRASESPVLDTLGLKPRGYALATLHRPSNVDDPEHFADLVRMLSQLARRLPVVFPIHPRSRARLESLGLPHDGITLTGPQGYFDFLKLMSEARVVLTDSGGIQEETTILQVPCLTLRENTERPATIEQGTNRLVGTDPGTVLRCAMEALDAPVAARKPELWDGKASIRILDVLERVLS